MSLSLEELKQLGESGFIPGPGECEEAFIKRVALLKALVHDPQNFFQAEEVESLQVNNSKILGAYPHWVQQVYSNKRLLPWQGAAVWILPHPKKIKIPLIQLRKQFRKGKFLGYQREEVLLHETVHAIRLAFDEPRFEEILAYYHSPKKWRQFFGALFRKPSQALFFLSLICVSLLIQTTSLLWMNLILLPYIKIVACLPFVDLFFRMAILIKDQRMLQKALRKLQNLFPKQENLFAIALRLKDSEIQQLAIEPLEKTLLYIKEKSLSSIRWQQILAQFS